MKKTIIITETQLQNLVNFINESNQTTIVNKIVKFLNKSYEPAIGTVKKGGEYFDKAMVKNNINNEILTLANLFEYLKYKFDGLNPELIKQIIKDWYTGNLKDSNKLSKNIKTAK